MNNKNRNYFSHLKKISFLGNLYKKYFSSLILFLYTRRFGYKVVEVGSGIGSGILGAYPKYVDGFDINSEAVDYCVECGFNAKLINEEGTFPTQGGLYDICVLDNVLEHIPEPAMTLDECDRITKNNSGLIIVVPGVAGYRADLDHKIFYDEDKLRHIDSRWQLVNLYSLPFFIKNKRLSLLFKQYCLVAIYKKVN
jgi:SAM-dependent methyltransferase